MLFLLQNSRGIISFWDRVDGALPVASTLLTPNLHSPAPSILKSKSKTPSLDPQALGLTLLPVPPLAPLISLLEPYCLSLLQPARLPLSTWSITPAAFRSCNAPPPPAHPALQLAGICPSTSVHFSPITALWLSRCKLGPPAAYEQETVPFEITCYSP